MKDKEQRATITMMMEVIYKKILLLMNSCHNTEEMVNPKIEDDEDIRAKKLEHPSGIFRYQKEG